MYISFFAQGFLCCAWGGVHETLNERLSGMIAARYGWSSESGAIERIAHEFRGRPGALRFFFDLIRELRNSALPLDASQ